MSSSIFQTVNFSEKVPINKTLEKAGVTIEKREYFQRDDISWLSQKKEWFGLKSIILTHNTLTGAKGEVRTEEIKRLDMVA